MSQLQATGETETDISNIIDELNNQYDSDNISNALNINALSQATLHISGTTDTETTHTVNHNLGYPPVFMVNSLAVDGGYLITPNIPDNGIYTYTSGPKTAGVYPFARLSAKVDSVNLYIVIDNFSNPGNFALPAGTYTFTYYLFSRPITN